MNTINNTIQRPHSPLSSLIITAATCFVLYISYVSFADHQKIFQQLRHGHWQQISFNVDQQIKFNFIEFRTGLKRIQILHLGKIQYEQDCQQGLNYLCKHIQNGDLSPKQLTFYQLDHPNTASNQLLLKSIAFIDEKGITQLFEHDHASSDQQYYLDQQKSKLKPFYFFTFISYLVLGYFVYFHHIFRYSNSFTLVEVINTLILIGLVSSYFYFGMSYFFF